MSPFYHGGPPGLHVGDMILPASETGAPSCSEYGAAGVHRADRVYLCTDIHGALLFAAMHPSGKGRVYEVEPEGEVEPDPDWTGRPGVSVQAPRAKIVRVHNLSAAVRRQVRQAVHPEVSP
ncbi:MAG: NAD(+)--rifampin ADP-ribosyltransferase [Gemmatimonadota bacterium]